MKNKIMDQLNIIYGQDLLSGVSEDQIKLLPCTKNDVDAAEKILAQPDVENILPLLLIWMKDMNWPVAKILSPYLAKKGGALKNDIIKIFNSEDVMWQYWVLVELVDVPNFRLAKVLENELSHLSSTTPDIDIKKQAETIICKLHSNGKG